MVLVVEVVVMVVVVLCVYDGIQINHVPYVCAVDQSSC